MAYVVLNLHRIVSVNLQQNSFILNMLIIKKLEWITLLLIVTLIGIDLYCKVGDDFFDKGKVSKSGSSMASFWWIKVPRWIYALGTISDQTQFEFLKVSY